jgi:putative peptidoglycan lipid II flippase
VRMLPFVVLVCLSAVLGGALNVRGRYFAPSFAPVVMNLGWIATLIAVGHAFADRGADAGEGTQMAMARWLATYVIVAGAILVAVLLPALRSAELVGPVSEGEVRDARRAAWSALRASAPLALGAAAYQVNVVVGGVLAIAFLQEGGSSLLYYVTRLQQLPMSLIAIAATSAVFPSLSALGERRELTRLRALHDRTHLAVAYVAVPASLGLFFFAEPILAVCFQHGEFAAAGVERATWGLRALALAILPAGATGLLARTYYALGDRRTPVRIAMIVLAMNAIASVVLVAGLHLDLEGLAWATSASAWLNLALLIPGLRGKLHLPEGPERLGGRLLRIGVAALASTGGAWLVYREVASSRASATALFGCIFLSMALYALFSQVLAIAEWIELKQRLRSCGQSGSS